jgi:hypothetical protein
MILIALPCDFAHALIEGLGPTYEASTAPEKIASTAAGPALKVAVLSSTPPPRCLANKPFRTPTRAVACVMFGK